MRAGILLGICGSVLLAACADTAAIKNFSQTAPADADIQSAAASYAQAAQDSESYNRIFHDVDPSQVAANEAMREAQVKVIVANSAAISQYMNELGAVAGLDTAVSAQANTDLKSGLSALQKTGKITAPEVAAVQALVDFVGGLIITGVQQYTLEKVIGDGNDKFQTAIQAQLDILNAFQLSNATDQNLFMRLRFITDSLQRKMDSCWQAAPKGTASRFPGEGCAQAYAAYFTFPVWYDAQKARIAATGALVGKLITAFKNIGAAHQQLYDHRHDLLTQATWNAIKPNIDQARAALAAVKKL
jgi:hypothetical protein